MALQRHLYNARGYRDGCGVGGLIGLLRSECIRKYGLANIDAKTKTVVMSLGQLEAIVGSLSLRAVDTSVSQPLLQPILFITKRVAGDNLQGIRRAEQEWPGAYLQYSRRFQRVTPSRWNLTAIFEIEHSSNLLHPLATQWIKIE